MPRPIRTIESNFTYLGPTREIADLPGQREDGRFYSVWRLSDEERAQIAAGANIELGIYSEPIPPVSITVVDVAESPVSPADGGRTYYDIDEPLSWWRRLAWRVLGRRLNKMHTAAPAEAEVTERVCDL